MPEFLLSVIRFIRLLLSGHQAIAIENAALRLQLVAFQRKRKRPVLTTFDRVFWITLRRWWSGWRRLLFYVQADTVARWQRERYRRFWERLSKPRRRPGRPTIAGDIRRLIEQMVAANPLWRAPRIHGELKMLGIVISERTVSRILRSLPRPPSQMWKTFLHNHIAQMVSMDFFNVPTINMKVLFVFFVLEHRRREVLHFAVTEHPTADWTAQQIIEAFTDRDAPRYLMRDQDSIYGTEIRAPIAALDIAKMLTAPQSPWQNPYAERLIGSIRRKCLNHFVILSTRHLRKTLTKYFDYYHRSGPHLGLGKQCPVPRSVAATGRIVRIPQLGGLHNRYERVAA